MNILFICTHNRCRSILCEAITNHLGQGRVQAVSAGSEPAGVIHPHTLRHLEKRCMATDNLRSQSWDDFADRPIDVVITVCDHAASEGCPLWIGDCIKVHWGLPDPSRVQGSPGEVDAAFDEVIDTITRRVSKLLQLELEALSSQELTHQLNTIAEEN